MTLGQLPALALLCLALVLAGPAVSAETAACADCHDFGPESPVHAVQAGSHVSSEEPGGVPGCPACHGASTSHARAPLQVSPAVSFGPRWTATAAQQDEQCLACHEDGQADHWQDALHMLNNLTCVTCHDVHAEEDRVLFPAQQAQVCTTCHKTQKKGIHGLQGLAGANPACSSCHNPHGHEGAQAQMLENGSAGCRSCHNLERMAQNADNGEKLARYHKAMRHPDTTCIDCHDGIAHAPANAETAMVPEAASRKTITLFYPGMADSDWLLQGHPGSQPLRQGRNCQQCHRGEEAAMGEARAPAFTPASRQMSVAFTHDTKYLTVTLAWAGPADDTAVSLMWGDGGNDAFRRGGCFAACHSDLPGMSRDRGQRTQKYLWTSREQQQRIGQPSLVKDAAQLDALMAAGDFVEMWRVQLASGKLQIAPLLAAVTWHDSNLIQINKSYKDGQWTMTLVTPLNDTASLKPFTPHGKYTLGVALHGAVNPGGKHWVSLPLTLSFAGDETDFMVEQQ